METSKVPGPSILNVFTRTKSQLDSEESETRTRTIKGDTSPSAYFVSDHILSNFFSLPRELRDIIYDLAIQDINLNDAFAWAAWRSAQEKDTLHDNPPTSPYPNLLSVNKQIRAEAKDIFYSRTIYANIPGTFWPLHVNTIARGFVQNARVLDIDIAGMMGFHWQPNLVDFHLAELLHMVSEAHSLKVLTLSWNAQLDECLFAGIKKQLDRTYNIDSVGNIFRPMCERLAEIEGLPQITTFVVSIDARKGEPAVSYERRLVDILSDKVMNEVSECNLTE